MARALFAPLNVRRQRPARLLRWSHIPLFWRLVTINLVVVLGGALVVFWLTQSLAVSSSFTALTHGLMVLVALAVSAVLTMALLQETFRPLRSLRGVIHRFNAGERTARAVVPPFTDPDVAALMLEINALWDRLEVDAATIREKTAEAERLAAQVISAHEEERRRVARELHDEAGQALTALIIGLDRGLATLSSGEDAAPAGQLIASLKQLAEQTLDEVRKLALELRPSVLDDLGLVAALRQYVRATGERTGLATRLHVSGFEGESGERLPAPVETALFRIAQEAMTNAARHARASSVQVRLRRAEGSVTLEVRDDGVGLPSLVAAAGPPGEHLGLFGMRERARLLGGTFVLTPVSPRGTLVQVSIPLPDRAA